MHGGWSIEAVLRLCVFARPDANAEAASRARCGKAIFVSYIVADKDRQRALERRAVQQCCDRAALIRAAMNQFDHAFAALYG